MSLPVRGMVMQLKTDPGSWCDQEGWSVPGDAGLTINFGGGGELRCNRSQQRSSQQESKIAMDVAGAILSRFPQKLDLWLVHRGSLDPYRLLLQRCTSRSVHLKLTRNLRDGREDLEDDGERFLSQSRRGIVDLFECHACRLD